MTERVRRQLAVAFMGLFGALCFGISVRATLQTPKYDIPAPIGGLMVAGIILVFLALLIEALTSDKEFGGDE